MAENSIRREGRVKRIEYLRYLADVRAREQQAWNMGIRITRKSIEEIREEFVRVSEFDSNTFGILRCLPNFAIVRASAKNLFLRYSNS